MAPQPIIRRSVDAAALADNASHGLLDRLVALQAGHRVPHLCLTGGRIANRVYGSLAALVPTSALDPTRLELWWGDERFLPTDDPERNAGPTLGILAGEFPLTASRTHPMPAADGVLDNAASAATYAKELGDTAFDICLLGMGPDGHVASIFPHHPSFEHSTQTVIGVNDAPKPPPQRISLTVEALNRSREVWYLVSGADKAPAVARALEGDPTIPGGVVRGRERTVWWLDQAAASKLASFDCSW